jgi:hypothetical protein
MLVLNLQFWNGDKNQAMELARLIADIEPNFREDVEFLFSARFDTEHDKKTIDYVSKKFRVFTHKTTRRATGWPKGPNALFADSYQYCIERTRDGSMKGEAILFIEADCVPLDMHWINHLVAEYKACGKMVMGAWLEEGDCGTRHINGNCIIHKDFWRKNRRILAPCNGGWDADCKHLLMPNGHPSRLIWSDYHLGTDRNPWKGCDYLWETKRYRDQRNPLYGQDINPVWFHGPKTMEGIECVRKKFNIS